MNEEIFFRFFLGAWLSISIISCFTLLFISAPYGRHIRSGWGPTIRNRLGWLLMETPSAMGFFVWFLLGKGWHSIVACVFLGLWEFHYLYRAFIYPFTLRDRGKLMPVSVVLMAAFFNLGNTYINARFLFTLSNGYPLTWLVDFRFLFGLALFIIGTAINRQSDAILRGLRGSQETGYRIPYGGLFRWLSSPNYTGEIIEWLGWAIATWSLPGLSFAIWTYANLAPRAFANHRWYREHFPDYPPERQALFFFPNRKTSASPKIIDANEKQSV
jgi:3-oxo-5-alpha-steroid 4-dehydrogenase 1